MEKDTAVGLACCSNPEIKLGSCHGTAYCSLRRWSQGLTELATKARWKNGKKSAQIHAWVQQFSVWDPGTRHGDACWNCSWIESVLPAKTTNRLDVVLVTHLSVFSPSSELRSIDTSFLLPFKCVFHTAFLPLVVETEQSFHTESLSVAKVECKAEVGLPFS